MTTDNGMDVSPSWQELMDERDIALANLSAIRLALDAVRSAHTDKGADSAVANLERIIMNDAAPDHMRRLKARWQAEALSHAAESAPPDAASWLMALSDDYRRQAEEPS